jgi:hypothetical protein
MVSMSRPGRRAALALFLAAVPLGAQAPAALAPPASPPALRHIDREDLLRHARVLAADDMRGRLTGTPEQARAADYVAATFADLGLEPLGDLTAEGKRGWLQHYPVERTSLAAGAGFTFGDERVGTGYAVLPWRGGEAVACRGPLTLLDLDPRRVGDLTGRVPLLLARTHSGKGIDVNRQFAYSFTLLQRATRLARTAERAGAKVVVVGLLDDDAAVASVLNYVAISPHKPVVRPGEDLARLVGRGDEMSLMVGGQARLPIVFTGAALTRRLLAGLGVDGEAAHAWVFEDGERPQATAEAAVELALELVTEDVAATNVVAVCRGRDPDLAQEAVVFSAHMDHVGERLDGNAFNGADDNASGTAGLLEIAQAFARAEVAPRRSVIFLSVSGEELGLWGSAWFVEHPTWEAAKLVADINTDMIGRGGPDAALGEVMLTPSHRHPMYSSLGRTAAEGARAFGLELVADDKFYARSDHYKFIEKGIPAVFFCCAGEHEDYHQVTDHADLLDGEQMERTARLAFYVGWTAANEDARPTVLGK